MFRDKTQLVREKEVERHKRVLAEETAAHAQREYARLEKKFAKITQELENQRSQHLQLSQQQNQKILEIERDNALLRDESTRWQQKLDATVSHYQRQQSEVEHHLELQYANSLRARDESHITQQNELETRGEHATTQLKEIYERRISILTAENADREARLGRESQANIENMIQNYEAEITALKAEKDREYADLKAKSEFEYSKLKREDTATHASLRAELLKSSGVLLDRDNQSDRAQMFAMIDTKQEPDENIRKQFIKIAEIVDKISGSAWREDQDLWAESTLDRLSVNQNKRIVKRAILRHTIWEILSESLLCSPFRLFGEEGKNLEHEWNTKCGADPNLNDGYFTWPPLSVTTERWRYFTVKECRQVLKEPIPSDMDPRARIKRGYLAQQDHTISELTIVLNRITAEKNSYDSDAIQHLVQSVCKMWLGFSIYRCRIVIRPKYVTLPGLHHQGSSLEFDAAILNTQPLVGRYGNANGVSLDLFSAINGCKGEFLKVP